MIDLASIKFLWKTDGSANGECPALLAVDGGHIVVGKVLSAEEVAAVRAVTEANNSGIGADEVAVFLPADVLNRLSN
jgi:hypothetical protein